MLFGVIEIILGLLLILGLYIWLSKRNAKSKVNKSNNNLENLLESNDIVGSKKTNKKMSTK
jgi:regulatory protein YycI of two-component signal transduction system YycFG